MPVALVDRRGNIAAANERFRALTPVFAGRSEVALSEIIPSLTADGSAWSSLFAGISPDLEFEGPLQGTGTMARIGASIVRRAVDGGRELAMVVAIPMAETIESQALDRMLDAFYVLDRQWRVVYLNRATEELYHVRREQIVGKVLWDAFPAVVGSDADALFRKVMSSGQHADAELLAPVSRRWLLLRVFPTRDGISVYSKDIHARRLAQEGLQLMAEAGVALGRSLDLDTTLHTLTGLIVPRLADVCVVDLLGKGDVFNRVAVAGGKEPELWELRHRSTGFIAPRGLENVVRTGLPEVVPTVTDDWLRAATRDEAQFSGAKQLGLRSLLIVPLVWKGRGIGALSFGMFSGQRAYSADDLAVAEGLADRAALAIENSKLYAQALGAKHLRDEVLGVVTHDLRNPLNSITLAASTLPSDDPRVRNAGGCIRRAAERADRLIEDLLLAAKIDAGHLTVHRAQEPVEPVLREVVELHRQLAMRKRLQLSLVVDPSVSSAWMDRHRMSQLVSNLIGNAIKFTPDGGRIVVSAVQIQNELRLTVSDTGPGIGEDELPRLFDRFYQGARAHEAGAGLGLAIAKGIAEAHGGSIHVHSEVGRGTTFIVSMPAPAAPLVRTTPAH